MVGFFLCMNELKSKAQLRSYLKGLARRGKYPSESIEEAVSLADLPEYVGMRKGDVRRHLGGYKSDYRRSRVRKQSFR